MKPLATLNRPVLETVDVVTKESTVSFSERTDVTAVPAMGVVAEIDDGAGAGHEALRKFGGDSLAEFVRNRDGFVAALGTTPSAAVGRSTSAPAAGRMTPPHPARRDDGRRQDHDGQLVAHRLGWDYQDSDADVEALTGLTVPELFARDGEAAFRRAEAQVLAPRAGKTGPSSSPWPGSRAARRTASCSVPADGDLAAGATREAGRPGRRRGGAPAAGRRPRGRHGPPGRRARPVLRGGGGRGDRRGRPVARRGGRSRLAAAHLGQASPAPASGAPAAPPSNSNSNSASTSTAPSA